MSDGADREQFWLDHIAGWKSSGLSLRVYCEQHGLKVGSLSSWSSKLTPRDRPSSGASPAPAAERPVAETTFLAVRVAEPPTAPPERVDERIELALPGGCVVRVGRGFDAGALERLLDVLERRG